ncbi:carbohydrate ABC transporter substrate-binding protein, CUT1 family [Pseudarthrobacter phenanthrenivorans Sphe3]|uniref:Carbohydrate ABC transporter substrate-binding protein, CUT1 family n=1 Tax=Pseudarthrobacter phenanthrenivorans (strain DSM 18606 / JCM 16027 / LMG 23796 / Sphe3) TaxID=930171 RepID=F0M392_PSEPM|nr:sugar ABC transporter substrate-binding protein [Pseudarthrobacter phenanthrenivorans]ADX74367.1 carbohydrate ABC transporter substrate-binding protein, CUT1 family [Pseudarthrobacter phenanthrenivorans Sphe3]
MRLRLRKSVLGTAAATTALALVLTGCGSNPEAGKVGTVEDPVTIRFAWWGNDSRAKTTLDVIKDFEAANPTIKVQGENTEFSSYWDKMATQIAGGTTPDVFAMSGAYPSEYASRGVLLDLDEVKDQIDTSKFAEGTVDLGKIEDKQYTITAGVNAMSMVIDPKVFEAAGVELPDDETWTWDDYAEVAAEITQKSPAGTFGTTPMANDSFLAVWARQHGEDLYTDDGKKLGISEDTATKWFELNKKLMETGGAPSASQTVEDGSAQPEMTLMGQGKQGMKISWSNQMNSYSGSPLVMMKLPGESKTPGTWLRSSMEYAISSKSPHPKEAAMFINYLVNNVDAATKIKSDRGMPANTELKAAITPLLKESQQKEAEYLDRIAEMDIEPPLPFPAGSSATMEVLNRFNTDVLFGKISPRDAAKGFIQEVNSNLG